MGGYFFTKMETNNMIVRHISGGNFTILNNELLQSTNMTFFTKGMLCYLLSLPNDWEISVMQLANAFGEKECRILKAFRELIDLGFCVRKAHHENGRLRGQRYHISDVAGGFNEIFKKQEEPSLFENTAPIKNSHTENTAPIKNSHTENTAHCENGGTYTKEDKKKDKINNYNKNKKTLFSENLILSDINNVLAKFSGEEYKSIDMEYYYHAVKDWSESSNTMRTEVGWYATIRTFIRGDIERNKLHLKPEYQTQQGGKVNVDDALNFLNM